MSQIFSYNSAKRNEIFNAEQVMSLIEQQGSAGSVLLDLPVRGGEDVLEETVDGEIDIAVIPGGHLVEPEDVVVLHPAGVLPAGDVDVLHVALVADQDDRFDRLVTELHCIDVISEPGGSTKKSLSPESFINRNGS